MLSSRGSGAEGFPEANAGGVHAVLRCGVAAQDEAQQVGEQGRGVGMPAALKFEVAEAHVVEGIEFRLVEGEHAPRFVAQQGVQLSAAVAGFGLHEVRVVVAQEVEGVFGEGAVVVGANRAVADAVFVDDQDVFVLRWIP